jgi:hypothetical protein
MPRFLSSHLNLVLTLLGGGILVGLLWGLGFGPVLEQLMKIGPGWLFIVGQEALPILANTAGWHYAFAEPQRTVGFGRLLRLRLAGDSLNYLVPSATLGGEIWRVNSLRREVSGAVGAASVTLAKFNQFLGQALFIALGLSLAAPLAPLRPGLAPWFWAVLAGCLMFLGVIFWGLNRRLFGKMAGGLKNWLPARVFARLPLDRIDELDRVIGAYLAGHRRAFWASTGLFALAWALGSLEVLIIFYFLGLPLSLPTAVTVETLSIFLDLVLFFMPAKLGTQEGGKVLIFLSLGLPPVAGLSFGLIRRVRELTWAGVGLICLSTMPASPAWGSKAEGR